MRAAATDWAAWHDPYQDLGSALSRRLRVVQDLIREVLPAWHRRPPGRIRRWLAAPGLSEALRPGRLFTFIR
jgi:hypothetical protein